MSRRQAASLALAVLLPVAAIAGCTGGGDDSGPTSTTRPSPSTTVVDRSGIALAGVAGETTTTIVETGSTRITGTVSGPAGLVPGATVRIERLVGGREVRTDVLTGGDGRFLLDGVPGGRYRLRAFLAPTLAQTTSEVRFLADDEEHTIDLVMEDHAGVAVLADAAPAQPLLDGPVNVVVRVLNRTVDADGVVRSVGVGGASVELTGLGRWNVRDDRAPASGSSTSTTSSSTTTSTTRPADTVTARTDSAGQVRFELRCDAPGEPGLVLRVPIRQPAAPPSSDPAAPPTSAAPVVTMEPFPLELPDCVDPATTTTVVPSSSTSTPETATTTG